MYIRTKIICTIGPAVNTYPKIRELIDAGMNVARLNFSHGTYEQHQATIEILKQARQDADVPLPIMLDTKGPEVRLGVIKGGTVLLKAGQTWLLTSEEIEGDNEKVTIRPGSVLDKVSIDSKILFDDGYISSQVIERTDKGIVVLIENEGEIKTGKGVNFPYAKLELPSMTDKDIADFAFACKHDLEYIAASFVRTADDVLAIKELLSELNKPDILVIAKIENHEGVENFDSIIQVADGIMIARGDLGVELPLTQVPKLQKMMIRKCYLAGKPAVTATQMLESMIYNPRPTRAEASDVANAIYDSTSVVMLSGETAIGKYPIDTVKMMKNIVEEAELDFDYRNFFNFHAPLAYNDVPSSVTLATVKTAYTANAKAIFAFTSKGSTARLLGRLRPQIPILAMTPNKKTYHQMGLNWGVIPILENECSSIIEAFAKISSYALELQYVKQGDIVIVTAGSPFGVSGSTNMMIVESIGDVLVRGKGGYGTRIHGTISLIHSLEGKSPQDVTGKIIVLAKCNETFLPMIKECAAIILQNHVDDVESEAFVMDSARAFNKSCVINAANALNILNEGQLITMDPKNSIIYAGFLTH